jgi:hypothetical protein
LTAKYAKYANGNQVFVFAWFVWFAVESDVADFISSAVRRGIVVAAKIKQGFKLRQERNRPPQPQRGCSIQPSVGEKRLRWVNG